MIFNIPDIRAKGGCMYYCRETLTYKGPVMSTVSRTAALRFIER